MNDFDGILALKADDHFTVFEAFSKSHQLPVVVRRCEYSKDEEAEFFIRSALMKTKDGVYSQPLVSIEADIDSETGKTFIIFVWKKGQALDSEIEKDRESLFPPGKSDFENFERITKMKNNGASINRAVCLTLGKEVTIKKFKSASLLNMNLVFNEALEKAKCDHPNICDFIDFRLFSSKGGRHCAFIVMERIQQDLDSEIRKRKELSQAYEEAELMNILQDVTAALLHAKSHGLAHRDIKPSNILRGPQGLKLTNFESAWLQGLFSETTSAQSSIPYMSPEAWETLGNRDLLQKPFESDVFSLGMTMLHLAAMDLPLRTERMSHRDLEALLQQAICALTYSDEFKRLCIAMLRPAAAERPTLETVHEDAIRIQRLMTLSLQTARVAAEKKPAGPSLESPQQVSLNRQGTKQQADELHQQGNEFFDDKKYEKATEMYAAADSIYSQFFPDGKDTATNFCSWGNTLDDMGNSSEAVGKYAAADSIYSRLFPDDKDTANNLRSWGVALKKMKNYSEAVGKYAAADSIYSRLFPDDKNTAKNLRSWGVALKKLRNYSKAVEKYAAADSIYSRLFPDDKDTATNFRSWGNALDDMGNSSEAVEKYAAAHSIYSRLFPDDKDTAINLKNWGNALDDMENYSEAMEKYAALDSIYSRISPHDKDTAINLMIWGNTLSNMGNYSEAAGKYAAADSILSRLIPDDTDTVFNLKLWGDVLIKMGNYSEAVGKYDAARAITVLNGETAESDWCDDCIFSLIRD